MGKQALTSHASGKSHKKHFDRKQFFFNRKTVNNQKHAVAVVKIILQLK